MRELSVDNINIFVYIFLSYGMNVWGERQAMCSTLVRSKLTVWFYCETTRGLVAVFFLSVESTV